MLPPVLLENRNFRRYFIGQSISLLGDQVTLLALPLTAVLALHATPGQMGGLLTAALVPNLIFSLHAGVWVDRRGRRRQVMLATDIGRGLLIATVPAAYAVGHLTWAHLYVVAFLSGTLSVFFFVAYVRYTCNRAGSLWLMHVVTGVTLAMTAVALLLCQRMLRASTGEDEASDEEGGRAQFIARLGLLIGVVNFALIVLEEVYLVVLQSKRCG